jgi:hypothetical protein
MLGIVVLPSLIKADTLPGTAGSPSPQVITVQGCSGCISTGSGGDGASSPYTGISASAYGQTGLVASFVGFAAYDQLLGQIDDVTVAPFAGNNLGTGYPASYGQPGVLVVQGGYQSGAMLTFGTAQVAAGMFTYVPGQPMPGPTNTTFTPAPNACCVGVGGSDYASPNPNFNPLKVNSSGQVTAIFPSAQPVTIASTAPVTFSSAQPVTIASTAPVAIYYAPTLNVALPTASPGGQTAVNPVYYGTGNSYVAAYPDTTTVSSTVTTATTTELLAGTSGENTYVFFAGIQNQGTNASDNVQFVQGTGATCGTSQVSLWYGATTISSATSGVYQTWYGGSTGSGATINMAPAAVPFVLAASNNLCFITTGTTINIKAFALTAQH